MKGEPLHIEFNTQVQNNIQAKCKNMYMENFSIPQYSPKHKSLEAKDPKTTTNIVNTTEITK